MMAIDNRFLTIDMANGISRECNGDQQAKLDDGWVHDLEGALLPHEKVRKLRRFAVASAGTQTAARSEHAWCDACRFPCQSTPGGGCYPSP